MIFKPRAERRRQAIAAAPWGDDFLLSAHHFQAALRRERLRADRSLIGFSLLTLRFPTRLFTADPDAATTIGDVLRRRVRETDTAGWLAEREVAILLPDTPPAGAWKLADDLRELLDGLRMHAKYAVYVYPSSSPQDQPPLETSDGEPASEGAWGQEALPMDSLFMQALPAWKRGMDVLLAGIALPVLAPLLAIVALAVKATSTGPALFHQRRSGWGGKPFVMHKFRTMVVDAEAKKMGLRALSEQDGPAFKLKNDPRITPIGRFLRKTSIDELPQLWNVLRGEMSLVGPRPLPCDEAGGVDGWQRRRLDVTPGLTCIWQVEGGSKVTFAEWMRMDLRYIASRRFRRDSALIAKTALRVFARRASH